MHRQTALPGQIWSRTQGAVLPGNGSGGFLSARPVAAAVTVSAAASVARLAKSVAFCLAAAGLLAGCSGQVSQSVLASYTGRTPGERVPAPSAEAARLVVRIPQHGLSALLYEAGGRDGVRRWQASDNVQIYTRDGLIIGTRGLGHDLMSTDPGPAAALITGEKAGQVPRIHRLLDGEDRLEIRAYLCDITPGAVERIRTGEAEWTMARRIDEICHSPRARLTNTHWVKDGRIVQTIQSFDPGLGPVDLLFLP